MEIHLLEYYFSMLYAMLFLYYINSPFYFFTVIATNYFSIIEKEKFYVIRKKISIAKANYSDFSALF